ncbi:hypothetical protein M378DRAFT_13449 [Amanita muscaria Koide BX008]|uniref:C2H2-type domain-containing protein n=1 Tax=Amanita muscaria (strain Koide BX008) TaxID=946122 RepID=A0A0C2WYR8_AMAMK|nr:hypothetical protein M378DRAFT_13449 [Amanita muscaria Koide BX008]
MSTTSYIDHFYLNYCSGEDMDTADDYSVAMLDMANSDFRDEYTNSLPKNDQFFFYQDADATIYDARFLEKITLNFPQYKHIIDTIGPHDHKKIKETYNSILDYHRRQQATKIAQDRHRHALKERRPRERIISVFEGSYDERTMNEEDDDDANVYGEDACVFSDDEQDMVDPAAMDTCDQSEELDEASEEDGEDPDYIDKSYQRWLRTSVRPGQSHKSACSGKTKPRASRASSSPYVEQSSPPTPDDDDASDDDDNDVPALIPDAASSPELQYIATPIASPTPRVRNAEPKDKLSELPGLPGSHAEKNFAGAGKSKVTSAGYFVTSDDLIVASWGSENGNIFEFVVMDYEELDTEGDRNESSGAPNITAEELSMADQEVSVDSNTLRQVLLDEVQESEQENTNKGDGKERPKCTDCGITFARTSDLRRHRNTAKKHTEPAFPCLKCNKAFTRSDVLAQHRCAGNSQED